MINFSITGKSEVGDGTILVRGHDIRNVVSAFTLEDSIFYQILGNLPSDKERKNLQYALIHSETQIPETRCSSFTKTAEAFVPSLDDLVEKNQFFPEDINLLIPLLHNFPAIAAQYSEVPENHLSPETFEQYIFTTMLGRMPDKGEERMIQAYLVSLCEHADTSPSTPGAQIVANLRGSFYQSALTFMLAAKTPSHFGALPKAMNYLDELLENRNNLKEHLTGILSRPYPENIIPGFGHRYHKTLDGLTVEVNERKRRAELIDPRVDVLVEIADEIGIHGNYIDVLRETGEILYDLKKLPINIDGVGSAILKEIGFPSETAMAFVYMGRLPMIARYHLEQQKEKPNTLWRPIKSGRRTISKTFPNGIAETTIPTIKQDGSLVEVEEVPYETTEEPA